MERFKLFDYQQKMEIDVRKKMKAVNKKKISQVEYHRRYLTLYNGVQKFKAYAEKKKLLTSKIKTYKDNIKYGRRKSALDLWNGRL